MPTASNRYTPRFFVGTPVPSVRSRFRQRMSGRIKDNQRVGARGGHLTFEDSMGLMEYATFSNIPLRFNRE